MSIEVVNRFLTGDEPSETNIPIISTTPLGNSFKIGDICPITLQVMVTPLEVAEASHRMLLYKLESNNPAIIQALDDIAFKVMDGKHVKLLCYCKPKACHGDFIKQLIEEKIDEYRNNARHNA